jgi:hypothetical protein
MLALKAADVQHTAGSFTEAVMMMAPSVLMTIMGLGTLAMLAWLTCRTTVYTLTDRRVVMRIGIVLTLTFNLPLSRIQSADLKAIDADRGDIALTLSGDDRIAWVHLWPHARPFHIAKPQPALRSIPEAGDVAEILRQAMIAEAQTRLGLVNVAAPQQAASTDPQTAFPSGAVAA